MTAYLATRRELSDRLGKMPVRDDAAKQIAWSEGTRCVLRRRQSRVVVRAADSGPGNFPRITQDRRTRVPTLVGLGAREAMPTLFDIPGGDEVTYPGLQLASAVECDFDEQLSLVPWDDDDEDASCFDE